MTDELDPRASGEYANELIAHALEAYDSHRTFLLKNATQSGYTMGNIPVAEDRSPSRELGLQVTAQDTAQPMAARVAALREVLNMRGAQNGRA